MCRTVAAPLCPCTLTCRGGGVGSGGLISGSLSHSPHESDLSSLQSQCALRQEVSPCGVCQPAASIIEYWSPAGELQAPCARHWPLKASPLQMANPLALNLILTSNNNAVPVLPSLWDIKVTASRVGTKQENNNKRNLVCPEGSSRILWEENEGRCYRRGSTETWGWENKWADLCSSLALSEPSCLVSTAATFNPGCTVGSPGELWKLPEPRPHPEQWHRTV